MPFARRQCCDMRANDVQLGLLAIPRTMKCNGLLNCPKKHVRRYGLAQKIHRASLDDSHSRRNVEIARDEYDRQRRTEFAQAVLGVLAHSLPVSARRGECSRARCRRASGPTDAQPKRRWRPRNRLSANDVPSLYGRTHRHRQYARNPASLPPCRKRAGAQHSQSPITAKFCAVMSGSLHQMSGTPPSNLRCQTADLPPARSANSPLAGTSFGPMSVSGHWRRFGGAPITSGLPL